MDKRDAQIARMTQELEAMEWSIKRAENLPVEMRETIVDKALTDELLAEVSLYLPVLCDRYQRVRRHLRRLYM
jgi:hypothetical protein